MSLESEIKANTEALKALTAALANGVPNTPKAATPVAVPTPAAATLPTAATPAASVASATPSATPAASGGVDLKALKQKITTLATKDEPQAIAIMTKHTTPGQPPHFNNVPPANHAALDADLTAALAPAATPALV